MIPVWVPRAGGIVPIDPDGTPQEEERFADGQRALERARSEYQARHYIESCAILDAQLPQLRSLAEDRAVPHRALYALLLASALVLRARLHWRFAERASAGRDDSTTSDERKRQEEAFTEALAIFRHYQAAIEDSRQHTDFGIALCRTGNHEEAVQRLMQALATGVPPVEAFAYLGMAHTALRDYADSIRELRKGLQLAPRDRVLLETLARTQEASKDTRAAARSYCQAAIEAGMDGDVPTARKFLEAALGVKPGHPQALSMLVELLRSENKQDEARQLLDHTLAAQPDDPWALGLRGMVRQDRGETQEALADFARVRVDSAVLAWVWLEHSKALADREPKQAAKLLREAGKLLGPDDQRLRKVQSEVAVRAALALAGKGVNQLARETISWLAGSDLLRGIGEKVAGEGFHRLIDWARQDEAEKLKRAAEQLPGRPEPREALAKLYDQRGELDAAARALREAIELAPDRIAPREMLADIYLRSGKPAEAAVTLDEAIRNTPEATGLLRLRAEASHKLGNETEALRYRLRAVRAAPEDDALLEELVAALIAAGLQDEAIEVLDRRLKISPQHPDVLIRKGHLLVEMGRFKQGTQALLEAEPMLSNAGNLLAVRISLGIAFRAIGRSAEAGAAFDRAIEVDNSLGDASAHKAKLLIEIAEYEAAVVVVDSAVARLDERDESHRARLGWLHAARGVALYNAQEATPALLEMIFKTSLAFEPNAPVTRKNLGQTLLRWPGREVEGRAIFEQLTELSEQQIPRDLVGWCHFRLGRHVAAEHWLRAALADEPNDPAVRFDLALLLLASNSDEADDAYNEAVKLTLTYDIPLWRGIFYVALLGLTEAIEEGLVTRPSGVERWHELQVELRHAEFPAASLQLWVSGSH